jgi:crotonobetainyl-CoA:carnitine CoA-transferase CaiB-like acyl-CoA transferase
MTRERDKPELYPLAGCQVVELAGVLAGPSVGQFLAELGAEVLKLEPPGGDITRGWIIEGETTHRGVSAYYSAVNWGKAVEICDLTDPKAVSHLHDRLSNTDIVLTNFRPGQATRWQLDGASLRLRYSRLIIGEISGYGPDNDRPGFDAVVQAEAGFMRLNALPGGPALKMPVALMDLLAAHQLKAGILAALYRRAQTGEGALVQVSLLQAGLASLANQASTVLWAGLEPRPLGSEHPSIVPYGTVFTTADGLQILLAVGTDRQFEQLCTALHCPELASEPRFATNAERVRHRSILVPLLAQACLQRPGTALIAELNTRTVPFGLLNRVSEAVALPQAKPLHLAAPDEPDTPLGLRTIAFTLDGQPLNRPLNLPPSLPPTDT